MAEVGADLSERQLIERIDRCTKFLSIEALTQQEIDETLADREAYQARLRQLRQLK